MQTVFRCCCVAFDDGTSRHSFMPQIYRCVHFITATVIFDECATQQTNKRVSVIIFALHLSSLLKCVRVWMWDLWWFIKLYRGRAAWLVYMCVCITMIHPISCHARFSKLWECHASFVRDTYICTHAQNAYVQIYVVRFWTYAVCCSACINTLNSLLNVSYQTSLYFLCATETSSATSFLRVLFQCGKR